jgi:hypothetical protein
MPITEKIHLFYRRHTSGCNMALLLTWLLVNLTQAAFTELANDEAYYWVYAKNLDFGYFDHPPAIALLIKMGSSLFPGEFGVRFFVVLFSTGFLWCIHLLTGRKNFPLLFVLFCAAGVLQAYGFIAVPDVPLLFFTALFFLFYRRYLAEETVLNTFVLSLVIAALLYSKYHGLLVLFFTLLSNPGLLKRKSFYLLIALSVLAYLPHIVWQIRHDYPSYQYHVLVKSQDPYQPADTLIFLLGQLCVAGPLTGAILYYSAFRCRTKNATQKAMKYTLTGMLVFFLLATVNAPVEANWTVACFVPLLVLGHAYLSDHRRLRKWTVRLGIVSCFLFACIRLNLALNLVPEAGSKAFPEFYGWKQWAADIRSKAGDTPVVFANSYQKASKYSFYAGRPALSLNNVRYRSNQYDLWGIADSLQGKCVLFVPNWEIGGEGVLKFAAGREKIFAVFIDNFRSYEKIAIETEQPRFTFPPGTTVHLPLMLHNRYGHPVRFDHNAAYPVSLVYCLFKEEAPDRQETILPLKDIVLKKSMRTLFSFRTPEKEGSYYLRFSVQTGWLPPGINSRLIRVNVERRR